MISIEFNKKESIFITILKYFNNYLFLKKIFIFFGLFFKIYLYNMKQKRFFIKIKIALPIFFIFIISLTGLTILFINYFTSKNIISNSANEYISNIGDLILEKTINYLNKTIELTSVNAEIIKTTGSKSVFLNNFNKLTIEQLKLSPQVAEIYYADNHGNFWMNSKREDNSISTQIINRKIDTLSSKKAFEEASTIKQNTENETNKVIKLISPYMETQWIHRDRKNKAFKTEIIYNYVYDPRLRPWYINSKKVKKINWTDPYIFSSSGKLLASGKPGITASSPVYEDGKIIGIVGVDIMLEEISNFISSLKIGNSGRAFLINEKFETIALKKYNELLVKVDETKLIFNTITNISDTAIKDSFKEIQNIVKLNENNELFINEKKPLFFTSNNIPYIGLYIPLPEKLGLKWYIGVVVPEDDFFGKIKRNLLLTLIFSLIFIFLITIITKYFSSSITNPLNLIVDEANKIKNFHVDDDFKINSVFLEIERLTQAISNMKIGLRSFRKYVPTDLVRYLIQSGMEAKLGGEYQDITVLFIDIVDFIRISESMDPRNLVVHLGEYLSELSHIIGEEKGTVDKYIGDAIMAFWNAPQRVNYHALKACIAALKCQNKLKGLNNGWSKRGLPIFNCRIGINTGRVVVGNMGSTERLNYSAIGDAVNLSSRLEGLAKNYGVKIIISKNTYENIKDFLSTRMLDKIIAKGKTEGVYIYELVGVKADTETKVLEFIKTYEFALNKYFLKKWDEAIEYFQKALKYNKHDKASQVLIARCKYYKQNPINDNWDGSYTYYTK